MKRRGTTALALAILAGALAIAATSANPARADEISTFVTPFGARGQIAIDNLTGLRLGYPFSMSYAGPIGFKIDSYSEDVIAGKGTTTVNNTSFWIAPSLDVFVINHLSVGGDVQLATTTGSVSSPVIGHADLPATTDVTIEPRVGWLFPLSTHFGIWPRVGVGYFNHDYDFATQTGFGRQSTHGVYLRGNCGFLYRVNETFFLDAAPELTVSLGASHSQADAMGNTVSQNASLFQLGLFTGLGILFDLR